MIVNVLALLSLGYQSTAAVSAIIDERKFLARSQARFASFDVVTDGGRGATVLCEGEFLETPAFQMLGGCVDTTGAGDAFHGAFFMAYREAKKPR